MSGMRVRSLWRDRRGGVAVLLSTSLFALLGSAAVAVDLGSVYLARRQLQGIADATALAATNGGRGAAEMMIGRSGVANVRLTGMESGFYAADPALQPGQRFLTGDARASASRVEVERSVPLYFARLLMGRDTIDIRARATATRSDAAAFSIGTGLASINGGVPNMLLSALAGTELNLSVMDVQGLASLNIDLLHFADALRLRLGHDGEGYGDLFDRQVPIGDVLSALADTAANSPSASALRAIAGRMGARTVQLSDIIDLGPMRGAGSADGQPALLLDSLAMLRMILSPPSGTAVPMDLRLTVPGLSATRLMLVTGPGEAQTPMLTITAARDMVVRTAQTRIYLESSVATALTGIASIRVPLYIELASAEARLSAIDCSAGTSGSGVTLAVTPSVGTVALADIDLNAITNFSAAASPRPAVLAQTIGVRVTGYANIALGGVSAQAVHFSPSEIAAHQSKTVSTTDLTQGVAASVAGQTQVQVQVLGLGLGTGLLAPAVGGVLTTVAPLLDGIVNSVTQVLGVRVGSADVRVLAQRCGLATIVA